MTHTIRTMIDKIVSGLLSLVFGLMLCGVGVLLIRFAWEEWRDYGTYAPVHANIEHVLTGRDTNHRQQKTYWVSVRGDYENALGEKRTFSVKEYFRFAETRNAIASKLHVGEQGTVYDIPGTTRVRLTDNLRWTRAFLAPTASLLFLFGGMYLLWLMGQSFKK